MMAMDVGWTALQWPGMEHVIVSADERGSRADGRLVLANQGLAGPGLASVRYELTCGPGWRVASLVITVTSATAEDALTLTATADGHWLADGRPQADLDGCVDVDINCTPLTNTLPIRRLDWSRTGTWHDLDVAYVSLPELSVRPTRQRYTLLSRDELNHALFRYESRSFVADLDVDGEGFVVDYPGIWRRITAGQGAAT